MPSAPLLYSRSDSSSLRVWNCSSAFGLSPFGLMHATPQHRDPLWNIIGVSSSNDWLHHPIALPDCADCTESVPVLNAGLELEACASYLAESLTSLHVGGSPVPKCWKRHSFGFPHLELLALCCRFFLKECARFHGHCYALDCSMAKVDASK